MNASCSKDDHLWLGLVAFVIGAVVLLQHFDLVPAGTWDYLWPSILVVTGLKWMLMGGSCDSSGACGDCASSPCACDMPMPVSMPKKMPAKKVGKKK